jgi:hypothetical protein
VHPGNAPVHAANSTAAQIVEVETNCQFKHELADHRLFLTVAEELKIRSSLPSFPVTFASLKMLI